MKQLKLFLTLFLFVNCNNMPSTSNKFPTFEVLLSDSVTRLNTDNIKGGSLIALLYFSPDCEHCQKETETIIHNINALKTVQFYFITSDPFERLKTFNEHYKLFKYSNIVLGRDEQFFLLRYFKGIYPPYLVIYDRHKRQKATFQGDVTPNDILSIIKP